MTARSQNRWTDLHPPLRTEYIRVVTGLVSGGLIGVGKIAPGDHADLGVVALARVAIARLRPELNLDAFHAGRAQRQVAGAAGAAETGTVDSAEDLNNLFVGEWLNRLQAEIGQRGAIILPWLLVAVGDGNKNFRRGQADLNLALGRRYACLVKIQAFAFLGIGDVLVKDTCPSSHPLFLDGGAAVIKHFGVIWPGFVLGVDLADDLGGFP